MRVPLLSLMLGWLLIGKETGIAVFTYDEITDLFVAAFRPSGVFAVQRLCPAGHAVSSDGPVGNGQLTLQVAGGSLLGHFHDFGRVVGLD